MHLPPWQSLLPPVSAHLASAFPAGFKSLHLASTFRALPQLKLKVGMPIILLRNMDFSQGLANGTRLVILEIRSKVIKARIMTGSVLNINKEVLIPRIPMTTAESLQLPITFTRVQFPIRWAAVDRPLGRLCSWAFAFKACCKRVPELTLPMQPC